MCLLIGLFIFFINQKDWIIPFDYESDAEDTSEGLLVPIHPLFHRINPDLCPQVLSLNKNAALSTEFLGLLNDTLKLNVSVLIMMLLVNIIIVK